MSETTAPARPASWKWMVCGLLLLATMLNYMDRMTLNQLGPEIIEELKLSKKEYGRIESAFAISFALGALLFGWLADRVSIAVLYPVAVLAWSAAGFATGFATGFASMLLCRAFLGLAESGNWPCALRTTKHILPPSQRTMGNSLLQSGAAFGAVLTPLVVIGMWSLTGSWRPPFMVIGALGIVWVALWFSLVRREDLILPHTNAGGPEYERPSRLQVQRVVALVILVITINIAWHFFRAWLPLYLSYELGYDRIDRQWIMSAYYIASDIGTLSAGAVTLLLVKYGVRLHLSRCLVFAACCGLTAMSVVAARLPAGPTLIVVLMIISFGALGLFPVYYSLSQDVTSKHQGKLTGSLGFCCWVAMAVLHEVVGNYVERTESYREGITLAGLAPAVGFLALLLLWGPGDARPDDEKSIA